MRVCELTVKTQNVRYVEENEKGRERREATNMTLEESGEHYRPAIFLPSNYPHLKVL